MLTFLAQRARQDSDRPSLDRVLEATRLRNDLRLFTRAAIANVPAELKLTGPIQWSKYLDAIALHAEGWATGEFRLLGINIKNKAWKT
ncbi:MAG: hypothetical protein AAFU79_32915, partial [Myxococcota bacterium]